MINVCDIQVMKPLLAEHGFHFSKAKGQNFLIQRWVPERIAEDRPRYRPSDPAALLAGKEGLRRGTGYPAETHPGSDRR